MHTPNHRTRCAHSLGQYHQHSSEVLDNALSPIQFMKREFPPPKTKMNEEMWRGYLDRFGFPTNKQTSPIGMLSDGQKSRLVFAMLAMRPVGV